MVILMLQMVRYWDGAELHSFVAVAEADSGGFAKYAPWTYRDARNGDMCAVASEYQRCHEDMVTVFLEGREIDRWEFERIWAEIDRADNAKWTEIEAEFERRHEADEVVADTEGLTDADRLFYGIR